MLHCTHSLFVCFCSDPLNTDSYKKELAEADVIVNCGADYVSVPVGGWVGDSSPCSHDLFLVSFQTFSIQDKLIAAINAATKSDKAASTKKVYIETSGCLCHGHNEKVCGGGVVGVWCGRFV